MEGRELDQAERTLMARIMRDEDKVRDALRDVLRRRDAAIQDLRWGDAGRGEVMPAVLRRATISRHHPTGLARATLHRATGEHPDRARDDEQEH